jgi:hypothetical protein
MYIQAANNTICIHTQAVGSWRLAILVPTIEASRQRSCGMGRLERRRFSDKANNDWHVLFHVVNADCAVGNESDTSVRLSTALLF